ncbi:MAG: GNAT family N-acetyltransferase [Paracoccaceae bacterium]
MEIGWAMFEGSEGKGYAHEAALAIRAHAYDTLGWGPLTSVIVPGNTRSEAPPPVSALRPERDWLSPSGRQAVIWRHRRRRLA